MDMLASRVAQDQLRKGEVCRMPGDLHRCDGHRGRLVRVRLPVGAEYRLRARGSRSQDGGRSGGQRLGVGANIGLGIGGGPNGPPQQKDQDGEHLRLRWTGGAFRILGLPRPLLLRCFLAGTRLDARKRAELLLKHVIGDRARGGLRNGGGLWLDGSPRLCGPGFFLGGPAANNDGVERAFPARRPASQG